VFLVNSRLDSFTAAPQMRSRPYPEVTAAFVAEFLNEGSLEHLGLLDLSTSVGLRYGRLCVGTL
jgi:hypothetical protein